MDVVANWLLYGIIAYFGVTLPIWLVAYRFHYMKMASKRLLDEARLPDAKRVEPEVGHEECEFATSDGVVLRGSYLNTNASTRRGVMLFCHELTGDRWNSLPYMSELREEGWDVFTFDFRSHGQSDVQPGYDPKPWTTDYEQRDVVAAVDYIASRPDSAGLPIVAFGVSRGGLAALIAAAERPQQIAAVVTDGAYPITRALTRLVRRFMGGHTPAASFFGLFPEWFFDLHILWAMAVRSKRTGVSYVWSEAVAKRVRQPVLMIYGSRDVYLPSDVAERLARAMAGPVTLWCVPNAKHNAAVTTAPEEYHQRLRQFVRPLSASVPAPCRASV